MNYLDLANSPILFFLCAAVVLLVVIQAGLFIRKALKRGRELGMEETVLKKAMTNSVMLSLVPSLPIIVMMLALSVPLGKYFPWLRLSIVGSAIYEGTAANVAAQSQGLSDISDSGLNPSIFVIIMFVMTIGIIWGIVFNILFMKHLDQFSKKAKQSGSKFVAYFSASLFVAMLITLSMPYVGNVVNPSSIIAYVSAGLTTLICQYLAKRYQKGLLSDFSLPIALIMGMLAVIVYANFL